MNSKKIIGWGAVSLLALMLIGCGKRSGSQNGEQTLNAQGLMMLGNQVFKDVYQKYDAKRSCWIVENDKQVGFCMKQASINIIRSDDGDATVYLLATGGVARAADAWGATGMAGMFVIHPENGGYRMIAQLPAVPVGSGGRAPEGKFIQLGKMVGGWTLGGSETTGSPNRMWQIFGLNGSTIQDLGTLKYRLDGRTAKMDIGLTADNPETPSGYSSLSLVISHTSAGKTSNEKKYTVRYDPQSGQYVTPAGWPTPVERKEPAASEQPTDATQQNQPEEAQSPDDKKSADKKSAGQKAAPAAPEKPADKKSAKPVK